MTVGIELLESFGVSVDLKLYERKNTEDDFYEMLCEFLPNKTIEREYAIGPYRVDFYIEEYHLIIEFDELFHEGQVKEDRIREASIRDIVMAEVDDIQTIIRVKAGKEITGLSRIIGYIALCSFSAIGVTSLYEDFKGTQ